MHLDHPSPVNFHRQAHHSDLGHIQGAAYNATAGALDAEHLRPALSPYFIPSPEQQQQQHQPDEGSVEQQRRSLLGRPRVGPNGGLPATSRFTVVSTTTAADLVGKMSMHAGDGSTYPQPQQYVGFDVKPTDFSPPTSKSGFPTMVAATTTTAAAPSSGNTSSLYDEDMSPPSSTGTSLGSLRGFSNLTLLSDTHNTTSSTLRSSLDGTAGLDTSLFGTSGTASPLQHPQLSRLRVRSRLSSSMERLSSSPAAHTSNNSSGSGTILRTASSSSTSLVGGSGSAQLVPAVTTPPQMQNEGIDHSSSAVAVAHGSCPPPTTATTTTSSNAAVSSMSAAHGLTAAVGHGKIPMYSPDGRVIGYRQDSSVMKPFMSYHIPASPMYGAGVQSSGLFSFNSLDTGYGGGGGGGSSPHGGQGSDALLFAVAAAEPFKGFPDAPNQVAGYILGPELGRGGFCVVKKAIHEASGQTVAIKIVDKTRLKDPKDLDRVMREMRVMRLLAGHVAIAQVFECVDAPDYLYLVMEHCTGGSLLDHVRKTKRLSEGEACLVLQQLLHALQHCHSKLVVHRDIKLENVLLDGAGHVKLIDFGLSGYFVAGKKLKCHCGSPSYAAPEMVSRQEYDGPAVDIWSLGIVLFAMLAGHLPFYAKDKKELSQKILTGIYKIPSAMSPAAQDLISKMLTMDPEQRIALSDIWQHPWLVQGPQWQPSGQGRGGLFKQPVDEVGSPMLDTEVLEHLQMSGVDVSSLLRMLRGRETTALTAHYHLLCHLKAQRMALDLSSVSGTMSRGTSGVALSTVYNNSCSTACAMERSSSGGSEGTVMH